MSEVDKVRSGINTSGNGHAPEGGATLGKGSNGREKTDMEYAREYFTFSKEVCNDPLCHGLHDVDKLIHQELAHLPEEQRNRIRTLLHTLLQESAHKTRRLARYNELAILAHRHPPHMPPSTPLQSLRIPEESRNLMQSVLSWFRPISTSPSTNGNGSPNGKNLIAVVRSAKA